MRPYSLSNIRMQDQDGGNSPGIQTLNDTDRRLAPAGYPQPVSALASSLAVSQPQPQVQLVVYENGQPRQIRSDLRAVGVPTFIAQK